MIELDYRTMYFFMFIITCMVILLYVVYILQLPVKKWFVNLFLTGKIAQTIGLVLTSYRGNIPDIFSIYIANTFLLSGICIEITSLISYDGKYRRQLISFLVLVTAVGIIVFCTVPVPLDNIRVGVATAITTLLFGVGGVHFFRYSKGSFIKKVLGIIYPLFALIQVARLVEVPFYSGNYKYLETTTVIQSIFLVSGALVLITGSIAFIFLLQEEENKKLGELNSRLKKFFSIISHDLRNPIANTKQLSSMLIQNKISTSDTVSALEHIHNSSEKTLDLLESLLLWARAEYDRPTIRPEKLDLKAMADDVIELYATNTSMKSLEIVNEIKEGTEVFADRDMLSTIFRNLLSNAIKFTPDRGKITFSTEYNGLKYIRIKIKDNGIGMSQSIADKLFDIDSKYKKEGTRDEKGTGFGLKLVKQFVDINQGQIGVTSTPGNGTTFWINLLRSEKGFGEII